MRVFHYPLIAVCSILIFPILVADNFAAQVTLNTVADTSLFENHPDANLGGTTLVSGTNQQFSRSRALFRFDLNAVPIGATITAVHVTLNVTRRPDPDQHGGPVDSDFSLFRLLADWGEGSGGEVTGSNAQPGDATWNERHFSSAPWATPGGLAGEDYTSDPSATTSVGGIGVYVWGSSTELIADAQGWLDDPATNFGFILISQNEGTAGTGRRFASNEQPGGGIPSAQLELIYTVPEPTALALVAMGLLGLSRRRRQES
jgi:PEP-CTERM motif